MKHYFGGRTGRRLGAMALLLGTGASVFADAQDFKIVNKTGFTITSLYASPVKAKNWGNDILGEGEMATGRTLDIKFSGYGDKVCHFDVMSRISICAKFIVLRFRRRAVRFSSKRTSVYLR